MDLVSFETREEYDWVKGFINGETNKHILSSYINQLHVCSECALLLDLRASVRLRRLRPSRLLPQEHQWVVLVRQPGQARAHRQQVRLPRLVRHRRVSQVHQNIFYFFQIFLFQIFFICRFNPPRAQPDNREETQQGGETESCMAVLNNFYGDGATRIFSKIFKYLTKIFQASNGTMLLATTRSRSSARMWRATSPSPGRPSPTSGSPERGAASNTIYLFIWKTVFVS